VADSSCHNNAQTDLGDAPCGDVKSAPGIERARDADDRRSVSGKDKGVGGEVFRVLRAKGADPDPEGKTAEKEDALLGRRGRREKVRRRRRSLSR
jgi:hypothetical protein